MIEFPMSVKVALHIAKNLRPWDRKEVFATLPTDDPSELAKLMQRCGEHCWVFGEERPICAIGGIEMWPGVFSMWMIATEEWPKISTSVTKFVKRVMLPKLWALGAHRLECRSMEGHPSRAWLEHFGAEREGPNLGYGKGGETFYPYAIRKK